MKKTINIAGIDVVFKASGSTTLAYRRLFNSDIFRDIKKVQPQAESGQMDAEALETFLKIAYTMAKQGNPSIPDDIEEWLDQFEMFDIYYVLPQILELWGNNMMQIEEPKKKNEQQREN